jgi:hypothetical protein
MRSSNFILPPFAFLDSSQVLSKYFMAAGKGRERYELKKIFGSQASFPADKNFLLKIFFLAMLNIV